MKSIRTIQVPLTFKKEDSERLFVALGQARDVADYASIMIPSYYKGSKIPKSPKLPPHILRLSQGINKDQKINTTLLSSTTVQEQVSVVLANFRSSLSNWISRLWRTDSYVLLNKYKLWWPWLTSQVANPPAYPRKKGNKKYKKEIGEYRKILLKIARKQIPDIKTKLVDEIMNRTSTKKGPRKPVNNKNRPSYEKYNVIELHNRSIKIKKNGNNFGIVFSVGVINRNGIFSAQVESSQIRDRSGVLKEFGKKHYQEGWCELTLEAILKHGSGTLIPKDGKWWLHITLSVDVDVYDYKKDEIDYIVGVHGGIYRPMSLVVLDARTGRELFHYIHKGKKMLRDWKSSDDKYAERQSKATRRGKDQRPITKKNLSIKYKKASIYLTKASLVLRHELHNATRMIANKLKELGGNILVCIHDFTGSRDKAGRLENMVGCEEELLPDFIRRMANRWPFHIVDWQLTYKLREIPNIVIQKIPLTLACKRCSVCGGWGKHGDVGKSGVFWEHWHSWFRCGDCGRQLNADRNAATNAAHFAGVLVENRDLIMSDRVKNRTERLKQTTELLKKAKGTLHRVKK